MLRFPKRRDQDSTERSENSLGGNMYRDRKLLDLAHGITECQLRIPEVCEFSTPNGCEPAHSNQLFHGKGTGMKCHDVYHVAACRSCHVELDNGKRLTKQQRVDYWNDGFARTMLEYFKQGLVGVK